MTIITTTQKIIKIGTSKGVTLPAKQLKELGVKPGDELEVTVRKKVAIACDEDVVKTANSLLRRYRKDFHNLATQHQEVFGEELYATVFQKAAAIIRGIIGDHPFADGNKRTAMLSGLTFLELNGHQFTASSGELEDFAVDVAVKHLSVDEIAEWLACHSMPVCM